MANYITDAQLKAALNLEGVTSEDTAIAQAVADASRAIDNYAKTVFSPTASEARVYDADPYSRELVIDDINTLTSLEVDTDDDGVHDETWTVGTDFRLEPLNNDKRSMPYFRVRLLDRAGRRFPSSESAVKVTGSFGWAAVPDVIETAALILAVRIMKRADTPFAIVTVGAEAVAAARLGKIDPDVATRIDDLLAHQGRRKTRGSIQLT